MKRFRIQAFCQTIGFQIMELIWKYKKNHSFNAWFVKSQAILSYHGNALEIWKSEKKSTMNMLTILKMNTARYRNIKNGAHGRS